MMPLIAPAVSFSVEVVSHMSGPSCRLRLPLFLAVCALLAASAHATQLTQLTFTGRDENWATWSPDGKTILLSSGEYVCGQGLWFCGDQNIWELSLRGGVPISLNLLLADAYHPRMSPDGQWVAAMIHNGNDFDIWLWPVGSFEGGTLFQSVPGRDERFPNWSNDSRFIAFDSTVPTPRGTTAYQVFYAPVDQPTDSAARVQVSFLGLANKHPTWNRDGTEIAYVGNELNQRSISAVRLSDGRYREVTPHASQNRHPDWSPSGEWIAFVTSGEPIRITEGMNGHDDFPEWNHDGTRLVFCGTALTPPLEPNKEIYEARDLPLSTVPTTTQSFSSLKAAFGH
jgi:Tol biopolymer transport system component